MQSSNIRAVLQRRTQLEPEARLCERCVLCMQLLARRRRVQTTTMRLELSVVIECTCRTSSISQPGCCLHRFNLGCLCVHVSCNYHPGPSWNCRFNMPPHLLPPEAHGTMLMHAISMQCHADMLEDRTASHEVQHSWARLACASRQPTHPRWTDGELVLAGIPHRTDTPGHCTCSAECRRPPYTTHLIRQAF